MATPAEKSNSGRAGLVLLPPDGDLVVTTIDSFAPVPLADAASDQHLRIFPTDDGRPRPRRIGIIAPSRSPIGQPFAGGLEAHVWGLTLALRARGHAVTLFAAPGSDPDLGYRELDLDTSWLSLAARRDISMQPDLVVREHHAYLALMTQLRRENNLDVVHNHSLHYLPLAMADSLQAPMLTTLHTPPTPWLESAIRVAPDVGRFVAVSRHTTRSWRASCPGVTTVPNGIDLGRWPVGRGGGRAVWSGRIAPEKGLHLAIEAATLAGRALDIAGPVVDKAYFASHVVPLLGENVSYLGHLTQSSLSELVRHAEVSVVSPEWDEPYGLFVAEALSSGTPVAAFARGGIPEILDESCGRLAPPGDVSALAAAIIDAAGLSRGAARARAEQHCSLDAMVDSYERVLDAMLMERAR